MVPRAFTHSLAVLQEKVSALETQAAQLGLQASQECERLLQQRTLALQTLQKEKERLSELEKRYQSLSGGRSFPKSSSALREVSGWSLAGVWRWLWRREMVPASTLCG